MIFFLFLQYMRLDISFTLTVFICSGGKSPNSLLCIVKRENKGTWGGDFRNYDDIYVMQ